MIKVILERCVIFILIIILNYKRELIKMKEYGSGDLKKSMKADI